MFDIYSSLSYTFYFLPSFLRLKIWMSFFSVSSASSIHSFLQHALTSLMLIIKLNYLDYTVFLHLAISLHNNFFFLKSLHLIFSIPVPRNHSLFPCSLYCCSLCLVKLQILKLLLICCLIQYVFSSLHLTVLHETEDFSQHSF